MKRLLIICGLAAIMVPSALAAHPQPFGWISTNDYSTSVAVPQQPSVSNPSAAAYTYPYPATPPCAWASTDRWIRQTSLNGVLAAGGSASDSLCVYQDWATRGIFVNMVAPTSSVRITVSTSTGLSYTITPTVSGRSWAYQACVPVPTFQPGDPALQDIAGSGGGVAVPGSVSITVTNPSSGKSLSGVSGYWGYVAGC